MEENKFTTLDDLIELSHKNYLQMLKDNKLPELLRAIGLFPDQTITNDVLILSQNPNATCVKRMKEWNFYKRVVKKSEKAIKVVAHHIENLNQDYTDERGNTYSQDLPKLVYEVGFVFDIDQTEGKEYNYLNSNKENVAAHFEAVKKALEMTAKDFTFEYTNQDENSKIDWENKVVYIKDGLSVSDVIDELIKDVSKILLTTRKNEGLENIGDLEQNCVIYAINSKLGLDLPNYDFTINNLTEAGMKTFHYNLQKIRSVTKQMLSNVESAIEDAVRKLDREMELAEKAQQNYETEKPRTKRTRTRQSESEVENA